MKKLLIYLCCAVASASMFSCSDDEESEKVQEEVYSGTVLVDQKIATEYLNGDDGVYNIYLPSDYQTSGKKYPVLYLLHGMWSNNREWVTNGHADKYTTEAIINGNLAEMIIVMPYAYDSFYVDGYTHNYESFFMKTLVPYIEANYPVKTGRENTAICGLSMGGFGASYYAFTYPEKFCFCYAMSGAVEGMGSELIPSVRMMFEKYGYNANNFSKLPAYFMDCGAEDSMVHGANVNTRAYLESVNFPFTYREYAGVHDWDYWQKAYKRMLEDIVEYFVID